MRAPFLVAEMIEIGKLRKFHQTRQPHRTTRNRIGVAAFGRRGAADDRKQFTRTGNRDFNAHGVGETAGREHILHFIGQIIDVVFIHGNVAVAGQSKDSAGGDVFAGEKR